MAFTNTIFLGANMKPWSKTASSTWTQHKKLLIEIAILSTILLLNGCVLFYIEPDPPEISCSYEEWSAQLSYKWKRVAGASEYISCFSYDSINFEKHHTISDSFFTKEVSDYIYFAPKYIVDTGELSRIYIKVKAVNNKGESDFSNVISWP